MTLCWCHFLLLISKLTLYFFEFAAPNFMARNPAQSQHTANNLPPRPPPNAGKPNVNTGASNCNPMSNNQSTTTLQMKQTQQLHINQHGPNSPGIHVNVQMLYILLLFPILEPTCQSHFHSSFDA